MKKDIADIILKAQKGDEEAFAHLYQHYYKSAFRYAFKLTNNKSDAEDVVQESFAMIHKKITNLKSPYAFTKWMAKIILSNSVRLFRSHKEILVDDDVILRAGKVEENIDFLPKEAFYKGLDTEAVLSMIDCMRPKQKEVLRLIYLEQKTFKEAAEELHIPEGTVKSRSMQAKKVLKQMVNDYVSTNEPLTFKEVCASGMIVAYTISKIKDIGTMLSANAIQIGTVSACVICGISAGISTYDLYEQQNQAQPLVRNQDHKEKAMKAYPNTFQQQQYQEQAILTSKNAYFVLMNWANTGDKMREKTAQEISQISPIVETLQESDSEYDRLLEHNGWYEDFETVKIK